MEESTSFRTRPAGVPGAGARDRGLARAFAPFLLAVFVAGIVVGGVWRPPFLTGPVATVFLLAVGVLLPAAWWRTLGILRRHELGARGEETTARMLDALPEGWRSFHGVPVGEREADHVVTGPGGVFLVETVSWPGRVRVDEGRLWHGDRSYPGYTLEALRARAADLAGELGVPEVGTVVCVAEGRLMREAGRVDGVWIGELRDVERFLKTRDAGVIPFEDLPGLRRKLQERSEQEVCV